MDEEIVNEITKNYPRRMHKKDKEKFISYLQKKADGKYLCQVERSFLGRNVIVGDLEQAKYVFTAHYDTPPVLPGFLVKRPIFFLVLQIIYYIVIIVWPFFLPASIKDLTHLMFTIRLITILFIIIPTLHIFGLLGRGGKYNYNDNSSGVILLLDLMKELNSSEKKQDYCFVFFDNEEKGLLGSIAFMKKNRKFLSNKKIINFDCIGLGEIINVYGNNPSLFKKLEESAKTIEDFTLPMNLFKPKITKASDHHSFKNYNAVMVCLETKKGKKYLMKNIHTNKDRYLEIKNMIYIKRIVLGIC